MLFLHPSRSPPGPDLYILSPRFVSRDREISIHALRVEGDGFLITPCRRVSLFLYTPSGGRATSVISSTVLSYQISIHALRVEGDPQPQTLSRPCPISIHALRVEGDSPVCTHWLHGLKIFLSTPSGWRATARSRLHLVQFPISIHALRVEGDSPAAREHRRGPRNFYPRPPGGGRHSPTFAIGRQPRFLSTPSGWRATNALFGYMTYAIDFYPRPPGGGRRHPLLVMLTAKGFLSTPSGWRATLNIVHYDTATLFLSTPSGWRATYLTYTDAISYEFLSTPSGWRATTSTFITCPSRT